jgi:DNA topoisomerase-1
MSKKLVIVESPAKAGTIKRYLGQDFTVLASFGHVRDLLPKEGAVDPANDFAMHYKVIDKNSKHVDAIAKAMKKADSLYLATDLDREGEAISWHLVEILKERNALDSKPVHRVVFHEITKRAISEAMEHPRELSSDLVSAQQARRALDYLVGFNLSPLLWKKIKRGLSAGRVQSPALRLIVEREEERDAFKSREYWTIEGALGHQRSEFVAKLSEFQGEKLTQFSIENEQSANSIKATLEKAAAGKLTVKSVEKKQRRRNPAAPFITSTLQQEGVRKLGFTAQRTMRIAQQLYEGVEVGKETVGLITYMRTDSVNLAQEAVEELRGYIATQFGSDQLPDKPRVYKTRAKNAQEAHEAIRPTSAARSPADVKAYLSRDQFRLYELIWKRTVACQMKHATIDTVAVDMDCGGEGVFRATGSTVADPGFMAVYMEGEDAPQSDGDEKILPPLKEGEVIDLKGIDAAQHFTEPPPRYSEATLVKTLEEYGIGRPSTYANIISTLLAREYVELEDKRFRPTDVGRIVNRFLTEHFAHYVDYEFTARLEDELDAISRGEKQMVPVMRAFWGPFKKQVDEKEASVSRKDAAQARVLGTDPKTGLEVSVRMGRFGPYVQLGTPDDENKPRFAGLRPGQRLDIITLEEALELFKLPRNLGETPEGVPVSVSIGRFGPYVKYGDKFVSLPKDDDPYSVGLERALALIEEKRKADAAKQIKNFEGSDIKILNGRYGPYITDGKKNARVPKGRKPASIQLQEAEELLAAAPAPRRGRRRSAASKA